MEKPIPNRPLTTLELERISGLTETDINFIDATIMACVSETYLKQARIVFEVKSIVEQTLNNIPFEYYSLRIQKLVKENLLESVGNLNVLRLSEVRKKTE